MDETLLSAAAAAAGLETLTPVARLEGHARNEVWRVRAGESTYVVKAYLDPVGQGWAREPAALEALGGTGTTPRLLGVRSDPRLVVLEDLGRSGHLADALLGRDPAVAGTALDGWVDAVADLHLAGTDAVLSDFGRRLGARSPAAATHEMPTLLQAAATTYADLGDTLGLPAPTGLLEALGDLTSGFVTPLVGLTPGDACPDNNVVGQGGVRLLDFEGAEIRHLAWDVAYLTVPWPTCWCAWRLPTALADRAVGRYRNRVGARLPEARSAAFGTDLDLATLGWCLLGPAWFLPAALDEAVADEPLGTGPGRRTTLLHRLWLAAHQPGPPPLTSYARDLYRVLARLWGEPTLVLAPAFRDEDIAIP